MKSIQDLFKRQRSYISTQFCLQHKFDIYLFNYINLFFLSTLSSPSFVINHFNERFLQIFYVISSIFSIIEQHTYDDQPKHNEKREACTAAELDV
jgi:hypothetical protein